ncbi:hypothetical protein BDV26DRAFT_272335, partial [Aspergillus bertholletiae]
MVTREQATKAARAIEADESKEAEDMTIAPSLGLALGGVGYVIYVRIKLTH